MLKYLINKVLKETKIRKEPQQDDSEQSLNGSSSRAKNKIQRLFSIIAKLRQRIRQLSNNAKCSDEEVMSLKNEVEQLKAQLHEKKNSLKRNSNTSSKPPSSDMGKKGKKNNTNSREPSGKASGGQFGHKGNTLEFEEHPDHNVELPLKCESCNKNHMDKEQAFEIVREQRRQVFELVLSSTVTEYTGYEGTCKCCGNTCSSIFPKGVEQPVQYGLKARAMMSLLSMYQLIPLERTCELMGDLMNRKGPVQGTIVNTNGRLCQSIQPSLAQIKKGVIHSELTQFDETGLRDQGKSKWNHTACTNKLTLHTVVDKRGIEGMIEVDILPHFTGTAVHDHWKSYYHFDQCKHSECNAHHLRYLKDVHENYGQQWGQEFSELLLTIKARVGQLKSDGESMMQDNERAVWLERYHAILNAGIKEDELIGPKILNKKGKHKNSKPKQLFNKLIAYDVETLAFMFDFKAPFDNNLAERDIRMLKLRQKISGTFRGAQGSLQFCQIRSYLSTARKNGITALEALLQAIKDEPFIPNISC